MDLLALDANVDKILVRRILASLEVNADDRATISSAHVPETVRVNSVSWSVAMPAAAVHANTAGLVERAKTVRRSSVCVALAIEATSVKRLPILVVRIHVSTKDCAWP